MKVQPDDGIYRWRSRFLGTPGLTFAWHASYPAYATFAVVFALICLVKYLTPMRVGIPPIDETFLSIMGTYLVMHYADFDNPVRSIFPKALGELRGTAALIAARRARALERPVALTAARVHIGERP